MYLSFKLRELPIKMFNSSHTGIFWPNITACLLCRSESVFLRSDGHVGRALAGNKSNAYVSLIFHSCCRPTQQELDIRLWKQFDKNRIRSSQNTVEFCLLSNCVNDRPNNKLLCQECRMRQHDVLCTCGLQCIPQITIYRLDSFLLGIHVKNVCKFILPALVNAFAWMLCMKNGQIGSQINTLSDCLG